MRDILGAFINYGLGGPQIRVGNQTFWGIGIVGGPILSINFSFLMGGTEIFYY